MQEAFYITLSLLFLLGCTFFGTHIVDWNQKRIADKYQNNLNHFLSDLYKLQQKWALSGEMGYAESIGNIIKLHGNISKEVKPGGQGFPFTSDAASTEIQIKKQRIKEIKEVLETEFID